MNEAWRLIAPPAGDRHGPLAPLLLALTVVTGLVDAVSYLVLGHVFVANMTGNVIFLAFAVAGAPGFSVQTQLLALGAFVLGAFAGGRVALASGHRGRALLAVTAAQSALLAVAVGIAFAVGSPGQGWSQYALIAIIAVAMGAQNAAARWLGVPDLTTTVLTLTITGIASDSRVAGGPGSRVGRRLVSVLAMLLGGLVGALTVLHTSAGIALTLPLLVLIGVCVCSWIASRSTADWTRVPAPAR